MLNDTHHLLVYAGDVNMLGGSVHTVKENAEALIVARKENGLEVNTDKTKYMVMSRDQNAGRSHNIKIDNRVEVCKLKNQNYIEEVIKSRLKSGNSCCHSVKNALSSS
jgi:DNA gyrase inhibitor GyrI